MTEAILLTTKARFTHSFLRRSQFWAMHEGIYANSQAKPRTAVPPQPKGKPPPGDAHCSALRWCLWENVHRWSIQLQTLLRLLEKFSGKYYTESIHYACNSISDTEKRTFTCQESPWPGELLQSVVHTKSL